MLKFRGHQVNLVLAIIDLVNEVVTVTTTARAIRFLCLSFNIKLFLVDLCMYAN